MALALDLHLQPLDAPRLRPGALRLPALSEASWETERELLETVRALALCQPTPLRERQLAGAARVASQLHAIRGAGTAIADLGGGSSLFAPACAAIGMQAWLIDEFRGARGAADHHALGLHRTLGVGIVETPLLHWSERFASESLDVVTCFDGLARWHHSPRPVFAEAHRVLKPGGTLLIGAPNAASLRRRVGVPLGFGSGASFEDWFYPEELTASVREPVLGDLLRLVRELGFERSDVWGRSFPAAGSRARRAAGRVLDLALRPFPTLCSELYVLARKAD
jgi:SAM-dependent methyltransferase